METTQPLCSRPDCNNSVAKVLTRAGKTECKRHLKEHYPLHSAETLREYKGGMKKKPKKKQRKKKQRKKKVRCLGIKRNGQQCKSKVRPPKEYCGSHRKAAARQPVSRPVLPDDIRSASSTTMLQFLRSPIHYVPPAERHNYHGKKDYNEKYLRTKHWEVVKSKVKEVWSTCRVCGSNQLLVRHHVDEESYKNMWQETWLDITLLCADCHDAHHRRHQ